MMPTQLRFRLNMCFVMIAMVTLITAALPGAAHGLMLTLNPTIDLDVNDTGSVTDNTFLNIQGDNRSSGLQRRALLKFDLSDPQLAGATINSATLTLDQNELGATADQHGNASLRQIGTQDWTGATSGGTLFSIARDANASLVAFFSPPTDPPPGLYVIDVATTVQGWVDGSFANFGFSIHGTEGPFNGVARQFDSSTGTTPPVLQIDFTPAPVPEPTTAVLSAIGLLGLGALRRRRKSH